jgi:hypothetical protein
MPEFTRVQWVSQKAQEVWGKRFNAISNESHRVELETVLKGARRIAMCSMDIKTFNDLDLASYPLVAKILDVHSVGDPFAATISTPKQGEPFLLRTVIGTPKWVSCFMEAKADKDDRCVGELLGYPVCCTEFFEKHWKNMGELDLTWAAMGIPGSRGVVVPCTLLNPMYNRLGTRVIVHMPCSMHCEPSTLMAHEYLMFWKEQEREWLEEILSWPVEYSALHGAAEIRTPILKIIHETNHTKSEFLVQFPGEGYPAEGASGNRFPYNGIPDVHSNNGFDSAKAMKAHHDILLKVAPRADNVRSIVDLGSGNGILLRKIGNLHDQARLFAIDNNRHAIIQGKDMFPEITFVTGDLFKLYNSADMVVFMPGRLLECSKETAAKFVESLNFRYLLLYAYSAYAHKLWDLKDQYWSNLIIKGVAVDDIGVAALLEKP